MTAASGERVTDVYAATLTPEELDEFDEACSNAQGVQTLNTDSCKWVFYKLEPHCVRIYWCVVMGEVANTERQVFVRVVAPNPQQAACPTVKQLCRGVVTGRSTYDAVRRAVETEPPNSPTPSESSEAPTDSPTPTKSSEAPTDSPTPTKSSTEPTETPRATKTPAPTAPTKAPPSDVAPSDPPVAEE